MTVDIVPDLEVIAGFVPAIAAQDFDGLANQFHPRIRFRALTPNSTFGLFGSTAASDTLRDWFGDATVLELLASEAAPVVDRVRLSYRFRVQEAGIWKIVEQQAMCVVDDGLITDISIVCSGFRPVE